MNIMELQFGFALTFPHGEEKVGKTCQNNSLTRFIKPSKTHGRKKFSPLPSCSEPMFTPSLQHHISRTE